MSDDKNRRSGFCAIVGRPNVGKSTYLNRVLGQKIAAVTHKAQTTRNRILGVKNTDRAQIVYVDTPGIFAAGSGLGKYMVEEAYRAASECDVVLWLVSPNKTSAAELDDDELFGRLTANRQPCVLGVNKIDRLADKSRLLPLLDELSKKGSFADIMPMSALHGDGTEAVEAVIAGHLPEGPMLFPEEMVTDRAERFLAAELVREQIFLCLGQELPYATAVAIEQFSERKEHGDVVIEALIAVEKPSQKKIVIGQGGQTIKNIGMRARKEISRLLDCTVHLKLFVKVEHNWTKNPHALKRLGYERGSP